MNFIATREAHLAYVPVTQIVDDVAFCFRHSSDPAIADMRSAFVRHGQTHPLTLEAFSDGKFRILDGHRRFFAAQQIRSEGGDWEKLLAISIPQGLSNLDRFRILREHNDETDRSYGLTERGRFFAAFRRMGLCVSTIAREYGMTVADVEDHLELADVPSALAGRLDRVRMRAVFAAMLVRRYQGWISGPHAAQADAVLTTLLGHAASEPPTIKSWRFLLDFYWQGDRPFMSREAGI